MTDESRESTTAAAARRYRAAKAPAAGAGARGDPATVFQRRTEEAYAHWIRRFVFYSGRRHPASLGEVEVTAFLNHLAAERRVAASTQNQALSALLFLYKEVLGRELAWLDGLQRATRPPRPCRWC